MVKQWKKVSFKDVCFIDAPMVNPQEAKYQLLPHIGNENIEKHTGRLLKFNIVRDDHLISGKYYFCETDVLYGKINPQFGKVAFPGFCGLCSADMYPIRCATELEPNFLKYVLLTKSFTNYTVSVSMRSGMPKVNRDELSGYEFDLPSPAEQKSISRTLSDIDTLIVNLEKLIAKKKAIKQGAMQELLTGKRRLPGFDGEWIRVPFQKIYKFAKEGGTPSTNNADFYINGNIPFVKIEDLECKYIDSTSSYITEAGVENSSAWLIPVHSVILSNGATIGAVSINRIPITTKQGILGIVPSEIAEAEYLYYYFSFTRFLSEMKKITTHGTMDCAYLKDINTIELFIPSAMKEQRAIVNVLSDMDSEIEKLGEKLYKFLGIKQGMMSELLTGRIRLIDKEDA